MKKLFTLASLAIFTLSITTTYANNKEEGKEINKNECAIWLCLPAGFPEGCGSAHSAMLNRLKKFKPPLPSFSSCSVDTENSNAEDFSYSYKKVRKMMGRGNSFYYEPGRSCFEGSGKDKVRIEGCIGIYREVKIFEKGQLIGKPYYF